MQEAVHNRHYELTRFTQRQERYYDPSFPSFLSWSLTRAYLASQTEVDALCVFLRTRKWSFIDKRGRTTFSGLEMNWCYLLGSVLLLRTRRHKAELQADNPAVWALSGSSSFRETAVSMEVPMSDEELRDIFDCFLSYLIEVSAPVRHPGVPPALLYSHFDTRFEYVWSLVSHLPFLTELFELMQRMVSASLTSTVKPFANFFTAE